MKLSVKRKELVWWILGLSVLITALFLVRNLYSELTATNYGFYGTHYDFLAFYSAGWSVLHHGLQHIYTADYITALQRQVIPHPVGASGYMPYLNPPFAAVLLSPLGLFGINTARMIWLIISLAMAAYCFGVLCATFTPKQRLISAALLLLTFPMYQTLVEGQLSIVILFGGCLCLAALRAKRQSLAGASLILLWFIPQLGAFTALGLLAVKQWQILRSWALGSVGLMLLLLPITGLRIYFTYVRVLAATTGNHFINLLTDARLTWRGSLNLSMGLNGFLESLVGHNHTRLVNVLYALTSLVLLVFLARLTMHHKTARSAQQNSRLFTAALLTGLLVDPHLFSQDIIVLYLFIPALVVLAKNHRIESVIAVAVFCNLTLVDQYSRVHVFALASIAGIFWMARQNERSATKSKGVHTRTLRQSNI